MKIPSVGISSIPSNSEQSVPAQKTAPSAEKTATVSSSAQDPKDKVGGLKIEGQMREAQVRSLLEPQFKMPGVEVKGAGLDDPAIAQGFKRFDQPLPSVKMEWPEKAEWKEKKDEDGTIHREMKDANGTEWNESIKQDGTRERLMTDKDGNRKMETVGTDGFTIRGGSDSHGNSWTIDSRGTVTRSHSEANKNFMEVRYPEGDRLRQMNDVQGNYYKETLKQDGKLERERGVAGHKQMEMRDSSGFWIKGFSDPKGNGYTVDSNGSSTRMHSETSGIHYSERTDKDGTRTRITVNPKGDIKTEYKDVNGNISRTSEKFNAS